MAWSYRGLPIIVDKESHWTLAEAAYVLGVPLRTLQRVVKVDALAPRGRRPHDGPGRAALVYPGGELIRLAEAAQVLTEKPHRRYQRVPPPQQRLR